MISVTYVHKMGHILVIFIQFYLFFLNNFNNFSILNNFIAQQVHQIGENRKSVLFFSKFLRKSVLKKKNHILIV